MRIFFAGDSTAQYNDASTFPQTGIVQCLELFFNDAHINDDDILSQDYINKKVEIINLARNGRSTKSFIAEGRLKYIEKNISAGDYLFVMFGHNDEKLEDKNRGTIPYEDFQDNLKQFADVAKKANAYVLFITPVARRKFNQGVAVETHGDYVPAMIQLAEKLNLPVIDMSTLTREFLNYLGEEKSKKLFMNFQDGIYDVYPDGKEDNTHLCPLGAYSYSKILAKEIWKLQNWQGQNKDAYNKLGKSIFIQKEIDYEECTNKD